MSLRKNLISNFILTASTILFPLITFPYITRTLSNDGIGRVFFIDAFTQYFIIFSAIGIPYYGIREVAKVKENVTATSKLVIELVILQFSLSAVFVVIFGLLYLLVPSLKHDGILVQIGCISIISNSFLIEWYYQGTEQFTFITIRSLIIKLLSVVCILYFVRNSQDFNTYYLILSLLVFANALLNFSNFIKKSYVKATSYNFSVHIRPLLILFSINVSVSIYTVLDTIILGLFTDPENVSYYTVPLRLVKMFWMVVGGIGTVLIPRMSNLFINNDNEGIKALMKKSFSIVFLLTIPFCFFSVYFTKEILTIISGDKYLNAVSAFRILSVVPLIIGVCNVLGTQFLLPIGDEKKILYGTIAGLIISLLFNIVLIPYIKFIGAAVTCVLAELTVCLYIVYAAKKRININLDKSLLWQIFLCLFITGASSYVLNGYVHNLILLSASVFIYFLSFVVLQFAVFKNEFVFSLIKIKGI